MAVNKPAEQMDVGDEFEPLEFVVTPELNQQYLYAEEDFHPRYLEETESGTPIVHPALLLNMSNTTRSPSYRVSPGLGTIHAGEETEFFNPAQVGNKLRVSWKVIDRFEKRGRIYHVREAFMVDDAGRPIIRRRLTSTYSQPKN